MIFIVRFGRIALQSVTLLICRFTSLTSKNIPQDLWKNFNNVRQPPRSWTCSKIFPRLVKKLGSLSGTHVSSYWTLLESFTAALWEPFFCMTSPLFPTSRANSCHPLWTIICLSKFLLVMVQDFIFCRRFNSFTPILKYNCNENRQEHM